MNILLDYVFPITAIVPTAQASTDFLKQVLIVVKPKGAVETGEITLATSMAMVSALTDNTDAQQLFNGGLARVYVLPMDDLLLDAALDGHQEFFTILISSDFDEADVEATQASAGVTITSFANLVSGTPDTLQVGATVFTAQAGVATPGTPTFQAVTSNNLTAASLAAQINAHPIAKTKVTATVVAAVVTLVAKAEGSGGNQVALIYVDNDVNIGITLQNVVDGKLSGGDGLYTGSFDGVIGSASDDNDYLIEQSAIENRVAFNSSVSTGAKNLFFAMGKFLGNALGWSNQQYITMPFSDDVATLGQAENLFAQKTSFVLDDTQYGKRLALLAAGGKAITAPYIIRNLEIDMQSRALSYISANQPDYGYTHAALLEDELQKVVDSYIERGLIREGKIDVRLEQENFVASGYATVSEPTAMWRIRGQIKQTLVGG